MATYKRILLKLSGESLMGESNYGIDTNRLNEYATQIKEILDMGVEVGIVIGGGNIFRGLQGVNKGFDRVKGDQMGMLATTINSIALQSALESLGARAKVLTSIRMEPISDFYSKAKAVEKMKKGTCIILAGGTGNPFFTTDTASALRAVEIEADVLLKGTRVDGVYTADPEKDPKAVKYDEVTFEEAYRKGLHIMDLTAFTLCNENNMPILVFDMNKKGNLKRIISGEKIGTLVRK
jgi:uridylate kinase